MKTAEERLPLNIYIPKSLKLDIEAAAEERGQSLTTFVTRTLNAAMAREGKQ